MRHKIPINTRRFTNGTPKLNSMNTKFITSWQRVWESQKAEDLFSFLALPTLITVVFYFGFGPIAQELAFVFLGLAIFWKGIIWYPAFWVSFFALQSIDLYGSWLSAANHTWVMWYWGLAMAVASCIANIKDRDLILINNARWLLILIMLVAVFWKVINPYYMDGSFFERNLVENPLMTTFTHTFGSLSWSDIEENRFERTGEQVSEDVYKYSYNSNAMVGFMAIFTTWWVLLIELVIGILLLFYRAKTDLAAHICHIIFIAVAYFAVPIFGFAWILVVLGVATAGTQSAYMRPWYTLLFGLLLLYALPWNFILFNWLGVFPLW